MLLGGSEFHVDVDVVDRAGSSVTESWRDQQVFPLYKLCGEGRLYGHQITHDGLKELCDQWSDGLDALTEDAEIMGETLTKAAQAYRAVDSAGARSLSADPGLGAIDG